MIFLFFFSGSNGNEFISGHNWIYRHFFPLESFAMVAERALPSSLSFVSPSQQLKNNFICAKIEWGNLVYGNWGTYERFSLIWSIDWMCVRGHICSIWRQIFHFTATMDGYGNVKLLSIHSQIEKSLNAIKIERGREH